MDTFQLELQHCILSWRK